MTLSKTYDLPREIGKAAAAVRKGGFEQEARKLEYLRVVEKKQGGVKHKTCFALVGFEQFEDAAQNVAANRISSHPIWDLMDMFDALALVSNQLPRERITPPLKALMRVIIVAGENVLELPPHILKFGFKVETRRLNLRRRIFSALFLVVQVLHEPGKPPDENIVQELYAGCEREQGIFMRYVGSYIPGIVCKTVNCERCRWCRLVISTALQEMTKTKEVSK